VIDTIRFETDHKYYLVDCYRDMLDDLVVVSKHGSKRTRLSKCKIIKVNSQAEAEDTIARITKFRYCHGYEMIQGELI